MITDSEFIDPQKVPLTIKNEPLGLTDDVSEGYQSEIPEQESTGMCLDQIISNQDDLNRHIISAVITQDPLDSKIFIEQPLHSVLECDSSFETPAANQPDSESDSEGSRETDVDLVNVLRKIKIEKKAFNCYHCSFSCDNRKVFKRHMKFHMKSEKLRCPECGNYFSSVYKVREHFRTHSGEKPYTCKICSFSTSYPSSFKYHMRSHNGEKPYACTLCDFRAVSCTMLTRHNRVHTGEKPFKCHICDYRARAKGTLKSHLRVHSGEKPFACTYCDKSFVTSSAVRKHLFIHTNAKEHKCIVCGLTFELRSEWLKHLATHGGTQNRCDHCGVKNGSIPRLKQHIEKNKGGGPYNCKFCDKAYEYKCAYLKHITVHEEFRPFKCEKCDYKGPSYASLRYHFRTKHSLEGPKKFECADCGMIYDSKPKLIKHLCVLSQ